MRQSTREVEKQKTKSNDVFSPAAALAHKYKAIREYTETICTPLKTEDYVIQSMPDVSPTKWHLAHTTWFFETFILKKYEKRYKEFNPMFNYLFNSYYVQVGPRFQRTERGLLSRPTVEEIYEYRNYVNHSMMNYLNSLDEDDLQKISPFIELGLNHEQQHQELILTDIKHVFSINPLFPVYRKREELNSNISELHWVGFNGGLIDIGHDQNGFSFDNETPLHREYVEPFMLASRLVTNGEYLEFILSGGYEKPELWLSDGWATAVKESWRAPLYWKNEKNSWRIFTLSGLKDVNPAEPVCHVSFYEAEAFARWKESRLATEAEWEVAAGNYPVKGNFLEDSYYHPAPVAVLNPSGSVKQLYGDAWEWTRSSYSPYPGFKTLPGAVGEYNGKFMSGQMVLRGGSCITPHSHIRKTYRNFFPPNARWQFSGIRLTKDWK